MRPIAFLLACLIGTGCASQPLPLPAAELDSVVPASIGVVVEATSTGVVIAAVGKASPAAAAGLRVGDVVLRYNGVSIADVRQFYRLMLESAPGSEVAMELLRNGSMQRVDVRIGELDTMPRA